MANYDILSYDTSGLWLRFCKSGYTFVRALMQFSALRTFSDLLRLSEACRVAVPIQLYGAL